VIPRATYRLQFHRDFPFADGEALVPYLSDLGISHVYASPITTARKGSLHGYDVVDPATVNPELGGEEALKRLAETLHRHDMGLIVDIVPNHMAASPENAWWMDVLRHGRRSRHASAFDIDWESEDPELDGKVFLPVLGRPLQEALAAGETSISYGAVELPLRGGHYLPAWWRTAGDRINWRRFFDINELVCLRMEDDETFERVHALVLRLVGEGVIDGLRVDHVDGLADPAGYCRKLRRLLGPDKYLIVEKILLSDETLATDWQCDGTTGYDFMDQVSALQHDPAGERPLAELWHTISGRPAGFDAEEIQARREIVARSFAAPLEACVASLLRAAPGSELSRPALRRALIELLVHFPVYRTYGTPAGERFIDRAAEAAKQTCLPGDRWLIDRLRTSLDRRFQQLSAPLAAKAVEDTAFYRHGRLLSRNDVGFEARRFSLSVADFHAKMAERSAHFPHALLATATHDHKRGEDVRARLAVLSEMPQEWSARVREWIERSKPLQRDDLPIAADVALLLQTIVGAWPVDGARLAAWQEKALREAKLNSDWSAPNERYEAAAREFALRLVDRAETLGIAAFVESIAAAGAVNGLAQTLLKLTAPGVPDFYQGTEYWDLSLVDPDNRRAVDFARRRASLATNDPIAALGHWRDGIVKQAVIARALALRRAMPSLFSHGSYEPVATLDARLIAFVRRHEDQAVLVIVPRLPLRLLADRASPLLDAASVGMSVPDPPAGRRWHDLLGGDPQRPLVHFPVSLLSTGVG
jgi:(1->4)-alpha-D-glucan 1-alpha-D-glucosylmutase